jgi:poly(A) polymerase
LQPFLIHEGIHDLLELMEESSPAGDAAAEYCLNKLMQPPEVLNPPPLITGEDLLQMGIPQGPQYRNILQSIRAMQLDGEILTREAALARVSQSNHESQK